MRITTASRFLPRLSRLCFRGEGFSLLCGGLRLCCRFRLDCGGLCLRYVGCGYAITIGVFVSTHEVIGTGIRIPNFKGIKRIFLGMGVKALVMRRVVLSARRGVCCVVGAEYLALQDLAVIARRIRRR